MCKTTDHGHGGKRNTYKWYAIDDEEHARKQQRNRSRWWFADRLDLGDSTMCTEKRRETDRQRFKWWADSHRNDPDRRFFTRLRRWLARVPRPA